LSAVKKILIVDDEPGIRQIVSIVLEGAGYKIFTLPSGEKVVETVAQEKIDVVILDLGLPGVDGLTLTRTLKEHSNVGVVILSGRGETTEKIIGLEIGADDYISKPFEPRELLARTRSVLRRLSNVPPPEKAVKGVYLFDGWKLDLQTRTVQAPLGGTISMSSGEFTLLKAFLEHPNRVLDRDQLMDYTHNADSPAFDRSVDVQIARLRKKIEPSSGSPKLIKTIRNAGYIFTAEVEHG